MRPSLIVEPHAGLAKTGGKERISVEPKTVRRIRTARGIDIDLFFIFHTPSKRFTIILSTCFNLIV